MTLGALSGGCKAVATTLNAFRRRRTMQRVRREPLARGAGPHHTHRPPDGVQSRLDDSYTMGGMMVGDDSGDDCTAQDCVPFRKVAPSPLGLAVHSTLPSTTAAVHGAAWTPSVSQQPHQITQLRICQSRWLEGIHPASRHPPPSGGPALIGRRDISTLPGLHSTTARPARPTRPTSVPTPLSEIAGNYLAGFDYNH